MPILFSIAEAAKSLGGISHWTLRKHVASGRLRVVRIGRRVFLDAEEIERIRREGLPSLGTVRQTPPVVRGQEFSATESK
jgi:excisionase family DNA binding protein